MRGWAYMLGGMIVWAVHFFALYITASIFLTTPKARIIAALVTLACLVADGVLFDSALRARRRRPDPEGRWIDSLAALAAAISFVAVLWQGLPALLA